MKILKCILCSFIVVLVSSNVFAAEKFITLKDGSTLKGEILKLENGVYTVQTSHLGKIQLKDEDITNISASGAVIQKDESLKEQVGNIQGKIYADEKIMTDVKKLTENPEVLKLLSDQNLMNDIMTFDEETIQNNPSVQKLLQNPDVQKLMMDVEKKIAEE